MRLLALLIVAACHGKQEVTAPPPPLRPEPEPVVEQPKGVERKDCDPTNPDRELKALTFDERSIPEGQKLADEAKSKLGSAIAADMERTTREQYITDAVDEFITALRADPYNVTATYYLAAAYAKIGRTQCSINMLTRLLQMRPHPSKHTEVEQALDRLLGRKQALDPAFSDMRRDERFRRLIEKMCEGTNDANCVYGGQGTGRER
jgi:hypothetical protein